MIYLDFVGEGVETGPISYVGSVNTSAPWNTTSDAVVSLASLAGGLDSAPVEGDLVIVAYGEQGGNQDMQVTTAGYTEVCDLRAANSAANNLGVFYKIMGSSPDTSVSLARQNIGTNSVIVIQVFRGVDQVTPMDVAATTATGTDNGQPNPPSITPATAGARIVCAGSSVSNVGGLNAPFTSSDLSNMVSKKQSSAAQIATGMAWIDWTSGAFDPAKWGGGATSTVGCWTACTMALKPA